MMSATLDAAVEVVQGGEDARGGQLEDGAVAEPPPPDGAVP